MYNYSVNIIHIAVHVAILVNQIETEVHIYIYIYCVYIDRTGALVCGTPCRRCSHTWNHQGVAISTKLYSMTSLILHHWFPTTTFDHKHPSWAQTDPTAFAGREQLFAGSIFVDFRWPSRTMTMEWTKHLEHVEACHHVLVEYLELNPYID